MLTWIGLRKIVYGTLKLLELATQRKITTLTIFIFSSWKYAILAQFVLFNCFYLGLHIFSHYGRVYGERISKVVFTRSIHNADATPCYRSCLYGRILGVWLLILALTTLLGVPHRQQADRRVLLDSRLCRGLGGDICLALAYTSTNSVCNACSWVVLSRRAICSCRSAIALSLAPLCSCNAPFCFCNFLMAGSSAGLSAIEVGAVFKASNAFISSVILPSNSSKVFLSSVLCNSNTLYLRSKAS